MLSDSPPRRIPALPSYAELHCRSNFSFLTGASHPEELVARAQALRYAALAVTDECSFAGVVRAHVEAERLNFRLIIGAEMRLSPDSAANSVTDSVPDSAPNSSDEQLATLALSAVPAPSAPTPAQPRLVLLAQTRRGYGNLSHWVTLARRRAPKGEYLAYAGDVEGRAATAPTLAGLPGCLALLVPCGLQSFEAVFAHALWLKTWFGPERAFIALELLHRPHDAQLVETVMRVAQHTGLRIVAAGDVLMHVRSRKPLQDTLSATRLKRPVAQCGLHLQANAEAHLRSRARLASLYAPEWLENTLAVAGQCAFSLAELKYEYPREIVPAGETPTTWLRKLTFAAVPQRFAQGLPARYEQQIEKELALIQQLEYEPYFLTVADIVRWARAQGILCQGRGSAANSLVCFCLGVTAVHPQEASLLFERFISVERREPPDIDVDFEHQRREEVIQYIYGKYGRHRAALTAVVTCYRPRSALRDVGRALGIDLDRIDAVSKSQHWWDVDPEMPSASPPEGGEPGSGRPGAGFGRRIAPERLRENGFDPESPVVRLWAELTHQLIGFPRHLSQHPGGFVIARDQIEQLVPVENAAMADRSVVQWDKDDLDALGLIKVDILALGMLSALRRSFEFIGQKLGSRFEMTHVPPGDTPTYDMLCKADTVGVFQVESRAQMSMLPRLQPRCYYDLVVQVAIVRPGPIQGGMVHPYLKNRPLRDDQIDYPPALRPALQRTKGIPIFQEQVMQIAMIAADFTAGEADQLRRAMAAWKRKGGLGSFRERLVERMVSKHYEREYAERIFKQMEGFGEYGFPESHAAGFAQLAYASSWVKCHHPDAFLAALLNSQPMGFYAPAQLVRDARAHGVKVLPVDVLQSEWATALQSAEEGEGEGEGAALRPVRMGLHLVSGLPQAAALRIVAARVESKFTSPEDLARRAQLDARQLQMLAQADALKPITGHRHQAAWAVAGVDTRVTPLLRSTRTHEAAAELLPPSEAQETLADYRSTGLTLKKHPLALLREQLNAFKVQPAAVLNFYRHGQLARASGIVTHRQRPETAKGVVFVTLEDDTGSVNVIVWPTVVEAQRQPLLASTLLTVFGVWQREGEVRHLVAKKLIDHSALLGGLSQRSRDFR